MNFEEIKDNAQKRVSQFIPSSKDEIDKLNLSLKNSYEIEFVGCDSSFPYLIEDVLDFNAKLYLIKELREDAIIFNDDLETEYDMAFYYVNEAGQDAYALIENCKVKVI